MTDFTSAGNAADAIKNCVLSTKNLPGDNSAAVPPDPMPNSEVKRRSADGSVGSPHVRVGNRQASNKAEGPVERLGLLLLCYLLINSPATRGKPVKVDLLVMQQGTESLFARLSCG